MYRQAFITTAHLLGCQSYPPPTIVTNPGTSKEPLQKVGTGKTSFTNYIDLKMNQHEQFDLLERNEGYQERIEFCSERVNSMKKRRFLALLLFLMVVILAGVSWFGLDHVRKDNYLRGYQELKCHSQDNGCHHQLCPDGLFWKNDSDICDVDDQSFCCHDQDMMIRCRTRHQEERVCSRVHVAGVAHTSYKLFCSRGFLWVPWRKQCFRAVNSELEVEENK